MYKWIFFFANENGEKNSDVLQKKKYIYTKLVLAICLIQISFNFEEKKLHPNFSFLIKMFTDT